MTKDFEISSIRIKLYGLIPLTKKQFLIYETAAISLLIILTVFYFMVPPPPKPVPGLVNFIWVNAGLIGLFGIFVQVIETLFFYNRFISRQLSIIEEQHRELVISRTELSRLNHSKDKFFAIIAHDVKNPFTALLSVSQAMAENHADLGKEEVEAGIRRINESSKKIYNLFENLLIWANSQLGNMTFQPEWFDFNELFEDVHEIFHSSLDEKKIHLVLTQNSDKPVYADRQMLTTVMRNLVSNAIKFSNRGSSVTVSKDEENDKTTISISDEGIGMSAKDIEKLFRIDIKNKSIGNSKEKGTGLGLILCKEFVEAHEGTIQVESTPGKGSTFYIRLPSKDNMTVGL
ncbi:MAG TPA: HAMP domain-containing sensor histidine kinase [Bacteroidales bacterium]|nr:HAMP domain-containing sensor histidine kinase [Bacteroidales bacterium]